MGKITDDVGVPVKPAAVMIRYRSTGRVMRVSREAFAREYAAAGWDLAPDVPTQDQPQATDEQVESVDPPAKKPRSRSRAKTAG